MIGAEEYSCMCVQEVVTSFDIVSYYINWVTTSWTYSKNINKDELSETNRQINKKTKNRQTKKQMDEKINRRRKKRINWQVGKRQTEKYKSALIYEHDIYKKYMFLNTWKFYTNFFIKYTVVRQWQHIHVEA